MTTSTTGWCLIVAGITGLVTAFLLAQAPPAIVTGPDGTVDASKYGVTPGIDCTVAFKRLVGPELPKHATILLPPGRLTVSATVDARTGVKNAFHVDHLWLQGAGAVPGNLGTTIKGNVAGALVAYNAAGFDAAASVRIDGISFVNDHPAGIGLQLERIDSGTIRSCVFGPSHRGLVIGSKLATNVEISVRDCAFIGSLARFPAGIGASLNMHGHVDTIVATQWGDAAIELTRQVDVSHARLEQNRCGVRTGTTLGASRPYSGHISGLTTEATITPIQITKNTQYAKFSVLKIHGTGNALGNPTAGFDAQPGSGPITIDTAAITGAFSVAAIRLDGQGPVVALNVTGAVTNATGTPWQVGMAPAKLTTLQSNLGP